MTQQPRASIIMPLLSQQDEWLAEALQSALNQTVPCALLVVTSPDTPASNRALLAGFAADHPHLKIFERPKDAGFAGAINAGFEQAATDRLGLLLSDDWLSLDAMEQLLGVEADIVVSGRIGYAADGQQVLWQSIPQQARFDALPTLQQKASYLGHFLLFQRSQVLAVGGVDPLIGHTGADDFDLPWTLLEQGADVAIISQGLYHYRDHDKLRLTLRSQQDQMNDLRKVLAKHGMVGDACERLVAEKAKWYGVPCHVAIDNPEWYLAESSEP